MMNAIFDGGQKYWIQFCHGTITTKMQNAKNYINLLLMSSRDYSIMFILQKQKHTIFFFYTKYGVVDDGDWTDTVYFHIRFITKQE